jgi:histidinol-phosphate/aromatic aminotransferase/cobyric acid decarboxylase-like protein/choline kinase
LLNNINKILIVTGYRSDELVNHVVNKFPNVQFEFVNNERYRETNNIYSLSLAFEQTILDDDILLIESDLIYTTDVITKAIFSNYDNVALVSPYVIGLDGTVVQVSNNQITNIFPPHLQDDKFNLFDKFKTLNIYKFSKDFCNNEFKKLLTYYANVIDDNCYYELILGILIYMQKRNIYCEVIPNEKWVEVDDPNDMMGAEFVFNVKKRVEILEDSFGGYWNYDIVDFCFIRNMYFPTKSMLAELNNNLIDLLSNYGSKQYILNKKLSYVLQYNAQYLLVLNGAAQVYPILKKLFSSKKGLIPNPTFGEYNRIFDDFDTYVDFGDSNIEVNDKIIKSEIVIFVNPNNPTGTTISTNKIFEIVRTFPNKFFVIDESFIEFSDEISIIDFIEKEKFTNVLVIRSMSKTYGLPGIRLGFIYTCNLELYKKISENIPIWNLNSVAEFYLEIILKNKRSLDNSFTKTKSDRYELHNLLKEIIQISKVYQSGANFILFRIDNRIFDSKNLVNYLLQNHSIYIKEVTDKFEDQSFRYYRAAVRLPNENSLLINSINNFFSKS